MWVDTNGDVGADARGILDRHGPKILFAIGVVLCIYGMILAWTRRPAGSFIQVGAAAIGLGVLLPRMRGQTKLPGGVEVELAPEPGVVVRDPAPPRDPAGAAPAGPGSGGRLVGHWPTVGDVVEDVRAKSWQVNVEGAPEKQVVSIKAPTGTEIILRQSLDRNAPSWLMAAIRGIEIDQ